MLSIFVSGLKKTTGKTIVSAGIAGTMQGLSYATSYYKPIQTGADSENGILKSRDIEIIKYIDSNIKVSNTYVFPSLSSPIAGAFEANSRVELPLILKDYQINIQMTECHVIEGSNGISTPLDDENTEADLIKALNIPMVIVVNPKESSIDEIIMGLEYVREQKVECRGVILTNYDEYTQSMEEKYLPQLIKKFTNVDTIGIIPPYQEVENLTPEIVIADTINNIQLEKVFKTKIDKLCC